MLGTNNFQVAHPEPSQVFRNIFFAMLVVIPLAMTPPNAELSPARNGLRPDA